MNQGDVLTDEDRAEIVERIQEATRGMDLNELRWTAAAWEFMASDLRRVCGILPQTRRIQSTPASHHAEPGLALGFESVDPQ